jgi:hypothetical protein
MKAKFTTQNLESNQFLTIKKSLANTPFEKFCIGFENGKRKAKIDGFYFVSDLVKI